VLAPELRDLRRLLRYRNLVVQQSVRMQNKMAGLLMEADRIQQGQTTGKEVLASLMKTLQKYRSRSKICCA